MITALKGFKLSGLIILVWLVCYGTAQAQATRFSVQASSTTVGVNEPFQLQYTIENASSISGFQPPDFKGFAMLSQMQSNSTSIVNGRSSQSISFIFLLQANAPGRYTIAGATARINGDKKQSDPITIVVSQTSQGNAGNNNPNPAQPAAPANPFGQPPPGAQDDDNSSPSLLKNGEKVDDKIRKNLFVKVDVDKTDVYEGEQITATYKLYTRLSTSSKVTKVPAFSGFSSHDIELPNPPQATIERINGTAFKVFTIRKTMLFPLQSGDLELDPVEVDNTVRLYQVNHRGGRSHDPFDDLFKDAFGKDPFDDPFFDDPFGDNDVSYHDYDYSLKSNPVKIHVKPLPEQDKPADFNGAVGHFGITASLDKNKLSTDDAGTLKVTINGSGNITLLNAPKINFPTDFETYDPKVSDQVNKNSNPLSGSRTFEFVFMPKAAGSYTIPPVSFSYFDPEEHAYKTVTSDALSIAVTQGKNNTGNGNSLDYALQDNEMQPIHTGKLAWNTTGRLWLASPWYWILFLLPLLVICIAWLLRTRNKKLQSDQVLLKNKRANKIARKRLSLAAQFLQKNDSKAFYEEVSKAVWGYICDKLNIPFAELGKEKTETTLLARHVSPESIQRLFALLDRCEMALYAGMSEHEKMQETYNQAAGVIGNLEEQLK